MIHSGGIASIIIIIVHMIITNETITVMPILQEVWHFHLQHFFHCSWSWWPLQCGQWWGKRAAEGHKRWDQNNGEICLNAWSQLHLLSIIVLENKCISLSIQCYSFCKKTILSEIPRRKIGVQCNNDNTINWGDMAIKSRSWSWFVGQSWDEGGAGCLC